MRAAGASGHALARIVHRARGLLHRVVRLHLAHCHHVSAVYGGNNDGEWHAQRVDDARGSRSEIWRVHLRCDCALDGSAAGRPTVSQWPVTRGTT